MTPRILWLLISTVLLAPGQPPAPQKKDLGTSLDAKQRAELAEWRAWRASNWDEKKGMAKKEAEWEAWRAANWNDEKGVTNTEAELADKMELLNTQMRDLAEKYKSVTTKSEAELVDELGMLYTQIRDLKIQVEKYKSLQNHKYKIVQENGGTWRFDEITGDICLLLGTKSVLDKGENNACPRLEY